MTAILAVDDDPGILRTLRINLHARGYEVTTAPDGRTAWEEIVDGHPDLVLLDLGLPDVDGIDVLRQIRDRGITTPVIVVSARQQSDDIVEALDLGANDYVTKPFGMDELLARVRAALRTAVPADRSTVVQTGSFVLDVTQRRAERDGAAVHLTPIEWKIIEVLTAEPGQLVRQLDLLQRVWGPAYRRETNYLRVYLAQLRRKLEPEPSRPRHFITEPGIGYRFLP